MKILATDDHVVIREASRVSHGAQAKWVPFRVAECRQIRQLLEQHPGLDLAVADLTRRKAALHVVGIRGCADKRGHCTHQQR